LECVEETIVRNQLAKAGTSIGANYREANSKTLQLKVLQALQALKTI
jgi:hypothetical protein